MIKQSLIWRKDMSDTKSELWRGRDRENYYFVIEENTVYEVDRSCAERRMKERETKEGTNDIGKKSSR